MSTITGPINHSITLGTSGAYASPLTITSTGSVSNNGTGDAIFGPAGYAGTWGVTNQGQLSATGSFAAIDLQSRGSVVNTGSLAGGNGVKGAPGISGAAGGTGITLS